jgi:DNA repair protein RadC
LTEGLPLEGGPLLEASGGSRSQRENDVTELSQTDLFSVRNPNFLRYLQSHFAGALDERFHATYCDGRGRYLHDEVLVCGSSGSVGMRARLVFSRALVFGATGLLIAHNHPSGRCRPSSDDVSATNRIRDIASALDIVLLDHLILTRDEIYSMRLGRCL